MWLSPALNTTPTGPHHTQKSDHRSQDVTTSVLCWESPTSVQVPVAFKIQKTLCSLAPALECMGGWLWEPDGSSQTVEGFGWMRQTTTDINLHVNKPLLLVFQTLFPGYLIPLTQCSSLGAESILSNKENSGTPSPNHRIYSSPIAGEHSENTIEDRASLKFLKPCKPLR